MTDRSADIVMLLLERAVLGLSRRLLLCGAKAWQQEQASNNRKRMARRCLVIYLCMVNGCGSIELLG